MRGEARADVGEGLARAERARRDARPEGEERARAMLDAVAPGARTHVVCTADALIDDETAIIPPKLSLRSGPFPLFLLFDTPHQEVLHIADLCRYPSKTTA